MLRRKRAASIEESERIAMEEAARVAARNANEEFNRKIKEQVAKQSHEDTKRKDSVVKLPQIAEPEPRNNSQSSDDVVRRAKEDADRRAKELYQRQKLAEAAALRVKTEQEAAAKIVKIAAASAPMSVVSNSFGETSFAGSSPEDTTVISMKDEAREPLLSAQPSSPLMLRRMRSNPIFKV
jgi:hypothetical protein